MKHNQVRQVVFPIITAMIWGSSFVAQKRQHRARGRVHLQRRPFLRGLFGLAGSGTNL